MGAWGVRLPRAPSAMWQGDQGRDGARPGGRGDRRALDLACRNPRRLPGGGAGPDEVGAVGWREEQRVLVPGSEGAGVSPQLDSSTATSVLPSSRCQGRILPEVRFLTWSQ